MKGGVRVKAKKLAVSGLLTALALVIFVLEAQIPMPIPVPGVKLGLANIITVCAVYLLGKKEACGILLARIVLGSLFAGFSTLPYSLCGGLLSILAVLLVQRVLNDKQIWVTGVVGGIAHNLGQMAMAVLITQTPSILVYLPVLLIFGILTGIFTGLCTQLCVTRLRGKYHE